MTAPNTLSPQGPNQYGVPPMPPDPYDPNQQPQQGQPDPNQQVDPNDARANLAERTYKANEELGAAMDEAYGENGDRLQADLDEYKAGAGQARLIQEANKLNAKMAAANNDPNTPDAVKQQLQAQYDDLKDHHDDFHNMSDKEHMGDMLRFRLDDARAEYAKQLAARRDSSMAIVHGRHSQVENAKRNYDVASALVTTFRTSHLKVDPNASPADQEIADRKRTEARLLLELGDPADNLETNQGEKFKLLRAERDARKLRSGRFELDGAANQVVEKEAKGPVAKAYRGFQNRWNKWTQDSRSEKWTTRWGGRLKKVASLALLGAAAGAAGGAAAGIGVGVAAAATVARATKATAGLKLNQGAEISQADAHAEKVAGLLGELRTKYRDALSNGSNLSGTGASVLISEKFSQGAHTAHKKNFRTAAVSTAVVLLFGSGAGEFAHHSISNFFGGDEASALESNGNRPSLGDQTQEPGGSNPDTTPTPEDQPDSGDTSGDTTDGGDSGETTTEPSPHPDHEPEQGGTDTPEGGGADPDAEADSEADADAEEQQEDTSGNGSHNQDPDAEQQPDGGQPQQEQPQGPQAPETEEPAPAAEVKTITPDQMDGKWVSQVYSEQLGDGAQAEMLSNAQEAINAGELEQVNQPDGTYYYKLTEAGAAKLPGAGVGSSTTGDVMRILASHSDKFTVA